VRREKERYHHKDFSLQGKKRIWVVEEHFLALTQNFVIGCLYLELFAQAPASQSTAQLIVHNWEGRGVRRDGAYFAI
jgi:hypothetical protein